MALLNCFEAVSRSNNSAIKSRTHADKAEDVQAEGYHDEDRTDDERNPQALCSSVQNTGGMEESRLLLLPKELRLEIWKYVLTDPSKDKLVLRIARQPGCPNTAGKRFSNCLHKHAGTLEIKTYFEDPPTSPINTDLLRINHLIYAEALPILYHSVKFCPWNLKGIFPLFLGTLSTFAKSHIRYIKLAIDKANRCTNSFFYWALTCAQVAKLKDSLRQVEVRGPWPISINDDILKRAVMYPLVKIKAPKTFSISEHDAQFQQLLAEAEKELEARALVRRASTAAEAAERARRHNGDRVSRSEPAKKKQKLPEFAIRAKQVDDNPSPITSEYETAYDRRMMPGIDQFEKELLEWDTVSVESCSPSPKPRTRSSADDDNWVDIASTVVEKDGELSDKEIEEWELINKPPSF